MLVLSRKTKEKILIGKDIVISVLEIEGGYVKIGIEAPREISVLRMEILEQIKNENIEAAAVKDKTEIAKAAALFKKKLSKE